MKLTCYPYVIFCGPIENITQCYVIINGEKYAFEEPETALDSCFQILVALRSFPFACDYLWVFFKKLIFSLDCSGKEKFSKVSSFIVEIKKLAELESKV